MNAAFKRWRKRNYPESKLVNTFCQTQRLPANSSTQARPALTAPAAYYFGMGTNLTRKLQRWHNPTEVLRRNGFQRESNIALPQVYSFDMATLKTLAPRYPPLG
jgi:hypothetical protein